MKHIGKQRSHESDLELPQRGKRLEKAESAWKEWRLRSIEDTHAETHDRAQNNGERDIEGSIERRKSEMREAITTTDGITGRDLKNVERGQDRKNDERSCQMLLS